MVYKIKIDGETWIDALKGCFPFDNIPLQWHELPHGIYSIREELPNGDYVIVSQPRELNSQEGL